MSRSAFATIHLGALRHNLERVRTLAPKSRVMAVIKADGYGHGLERVARALSGADAFGVAAIADGQRLRAAGIDHRIVVLSGIDEAGDLLEVRRLGLDIVVHHDHQIALITADPDPRPLRIWLKIDTGMHRLGFDPTRTTALLAQLRALANVHDDIVLMSHFARSDEPADAATTQQLARFAAAGATALPHSIANSAAIVHFADARTDWVRAGGALYGLSVEHDRCGADDGFRPAMSLSSKLIAINRVAKGERVGYGGSYACPDDMAVGVVAIGYGDGYPRSAATGTPVRLNGRDARIIGRVSMDLMMIDLRDHADANINDRVLLWGRDLPVERIAAAAGTISYELTCGITRRVMFLEDDT
ncbi:MAG: alanine racemase [Rhodanobacteraceae bacterium]|nr:alanine racemase [Rhodanobacteraceae bacterium]MBK7042629.1 alanine racemase [Rhodanobacteraceae bacterium]MBP9153505.1 alanine racemase [Xanthomonadales bacterium]HQW80508.1 alanine racemase [Pseudomonadota bacterium]